MTEKILILMLFANIVGLSGAIYFIYCICEHKHQETLKQLWNFEHYIEDYIRKERQECRQQQG